MAELRNQPPNGVSNGALLTSVMLHEAGMWGPLLRRVLSLRDHVREISHHFVARPGLVQPGDDPFALPRIEILRMHRGPLFLWKVVTGRRLRRT